ncbi:MAG TPA: gamma-glutamyl-gamma-aminobutyrate hydrolase family protein [Candidatus Binatia bacterium]
MKKTRRDRPLVGITPDLLADLRPTQGGEQSRTAPRSGDKSEPLLVLQERYARAVQQAGAIPLVLPITPSRSAIRSAIETLDGIVVSGGNFDIHPAYYGEKPIKQLGYVQAERTEFELGLIALGLERDVPILGVCGGAQAINVALGGSLVQDIASQFHGAVEHQQSKLKDRGGHAVRIVAGTKLRRIVGRASLEVNTTHHQAVKTTGKNLIVNATAEDDIIEGIESKDHSFVLGVQWHPEFLVHRDVAQKKIFSAFVAACRRTG